MSPSQRIDGLLSICFIFTPPGTPCLPKRLEYFSKAPCFRKPNMNRQRRKPQAPQRNPLYPLPSQASEPRSSVQLSPRSPQPHASTSAQHKSPIFVARKKATIYSPPAPLVALMRRSPSPELSGSFMNTDSGIMVSSSSSGFI